MEKIQISSRVMLMMFYPEADIEELPYGSVAIAAKLGLAPDTVMVQYFTKGPEDRGDILVWRSRTSVKDDGLSEDPSIIKLGDFKEAFMAPPGGGRWYVTRHYAKVTDISGYIGWTLDEAKAFAKKLAAALG